MSQLFQKITKENLSQMIDLYNKGVTDNYVILSQFDVKDNKNVSIIAQKFNNDIWLKSVYTENLHKVNELQR